MQEYMYYNQSPKTEDKKYTFENILGSTRTTLSTKHAIYLKKVHILLQFKLELAFHSNMVLNLKGVHVLPKFNIIVFLTEEYTYYLPSIRKKTHTKKKQQTNIKKHIEINGVVHVLLNRSSVP